jgi:hypothetical protein
MLPAHLWQTFRYLVAKDSPICRPRYLLHWLTSGLALPDSHPANRLPGIDRCWWWRVDDGCPDDRE